MNELVKREDILARAEDRRNLCRIMSWAHLYVSIRWSHTNLYIGIPSTVLAAAASVQAIADLQAENGARYGLYIILSILVASLAPLLTFLNPMDRATNHLSASRVYEQMGDAYDKFLLYCLVNPQDLIVELEKLVALNEQYNELKKPLPITPEWAYQKSVKQSKDKNLVATLAENYDGKVNVK
ncbi:MAG: SLATT domain-containing protein [Arthrospira sp. PLM2.Bin9]|nr:SLATT domain-containing protein [Arthrospira sp. PLM2.Bin9]TVU55226.1 MAG: SLATT domain-containing protein [Arthrospira sp. PLM2.Bin9]